MGADAPISVQSMTNTYTGDVEATVAQVQQLAEAGCEIVRMAVNDAAAAEAVREIRARTQVPLVADIHFDYRLAITAIENGIDKIRFNPGNIGSEANVRALVDCAKAHHVPIRVGVNAGSLDKALLARYGAPTPAALAESALSHVRILERAGFSDIVISAKISSVPETVETYHLLSKACDYPLHVGVTEAGGGRIAFTRSNGNTTATNYVNQSEKPWIVGGGAMAFGCNTDFDGAAYTIQKDGFCILLTRQ